MEFNVFIQFVESLLPQLRSTALDYFYNKQLDVEFKGDNSPVTAADRAIEAYIAQQIATSFPDHALLSEEGAAINLPQAKYRWVIDPIDGTQSFIHGVPLFSTLIALMRNGKPLYGAIYLPVSNEIVYGDGGQALLNGTKPTFCRHTTTIAEATLLTSATKHIYALRSKEGFDRLASRCRCFRTWGDGYGYFLLATGRADIMVDAKMQEWDRMALIPIIQGAGGIITDYYGNDPITGDSTVASVAPLHANVLQILNNQTY